MAILEHIRFGRSGFALWVTFGVMVTFFGTCCNGLPITACPAYKGNFYLADHVNKCTYYWCLSGRMLGSYRCPLGTGVANFHRSNRNPCQTTVKTCSRYGINTGIDPSTPPPTTRKTTTTPAMETTQQDYDNDDVTTASMEDMTSTESTDVTTQTDDVTAEEMTEETGSGDTEDFMPVGGATDGPGIDIGDVTPGSGTGSLFEVHAGMNLSGGLKLSGVLDLPSCLSACSRLSHVCVGIDFNRASMSCYIHTVASECGDLNPEPDTDHIRFMQC